MPGLSQSAGRPGAVADAASPLPPPRRKWKPDNLFSKRTKLWYTFICETEQVSASRWSFALCTGLKPEDRDAQVNFFTQTAVTH